MKFGQGFTYNGKSTDDYNLILCSDETANEYNLSMEREMVTGSITNARHEVYGLTGKYSDLLDLNFMLIRNPNIYTVPEVQKFTRDELREIIAWLSSPNTPLLLEFEDYDESQEPVDFYGNFTSITPFTFGNVYGLEVKFQCNASWGFSKEKTYSAELSSSDNYTIFEINNTSDDWESYVYPYFIITPLALEETITIQNITDDMGTFSFMGYTNLPVNIDCKRLMVWDDAGVVNYSSLGWTTDTMDTIYWPRLIHGVNKIKVTGNCKVEIKCRFPRKVGEL